MTHRRDPNDYMVGWVCALQIELEVATAMLDDVHDDTLSSDKEYSGDSVWTRGRIGDHNIVIVNLPVDEYGTNAAAERASTMKLTFPSLKFIFMVGIGGGVPGFDHKVRLGDVVLGLAKTKYGGVVHYNLGRRMPDGFLLTGHLARPPPVITNFLPKFQTHQTFNGVRLSSFIDQMLQKWPSLKSTYSRPASKADLLFQAHYEHPKGNPTCDQCDTKEQIRLEERTNPTIHLGLIASGNEVMKSATDRDKLVEQIGEDVLCFEMEAAGILNILPTLVVRGICDYSDSHKNKKWQGYAAAAAAAWTKEFLLAMPGKAVNADGKFLQSAPPTMRVEPVIAHTTFTASAAGTGGVYQIGTVVARDAFFGQAKREEDLQWLTPNQYDNRHRSIKEDRVEGIGRWLLDTPQYNHWRSSTIAPNMLWCYGDPGAGKTFITCLVIEDVIGTLLSEVAGVAYVYFDYADREAQTAENVAASLTKQLLLQGSSRNEVQQLRKKCKDRNSRPTIDELFQLLQDTCRHFPKVYLILDALDECEERERQTISKHVRKIDQEKCRFFVTSRPFIKVLEQSFPDLEKIEIKAPSSDIRLLAKNKIESDEELSEIVGDDERLETVIVDKIVQRSKDMILLASLQLDIVAKCTNESEVMESLQGIPDDLGDFYNKTLKRIDAQPPNLKKLAYRVLLWLSHARRPLTVQEFGHAITIQLDSDTDAKKTTNQKVILRVCMGLIVVDVASIIRLAHFSMQEFLRTHLEDVQTSLAWIEPNLIAKTCLAVLLIHEFDAGPCTSLFQLERRMESYPILGYSASNWAYHASVADRSQIEPLIIRFLLDDNRVATAHQALLMETGQEYRAFEAASELFTGLQMAAFLGDWKSVEALLARSLDINCQTRSGETPLILAATAGHAAVVKVLLNQEDIIVDHKDKRSETALSYAAGNGHTTVVELLLCHGDASLRSEERNYSMPMWYAATKGHFEILKLMFKYLGEGIEAKQMVFRTLDEALSRGDLSAAHALMGLSGIIVSGSGRELKMLRTAVENGDEALVKLLAGGGADLDSRDESGLSVLHLAAKRGQDSLIWLLVDMGADINAETPTAETPLFWSLACGHLRTADLILELGAQIALDTDAGRMILPCASFAGHMAIVKDLLAKGANVDAQAISAQNQGLYQASTALLWAVSQGHDAIVRLLLQHGADVNAKSGADTVTRRFVHASKLESFEAGVTSLIWAARRGSTSVVTLLLEKGANLDAQSSSGETALHAAAYAHHEDMMLLLIKNGADPMIRSGWGNTALHIAARNNLAIACQELVKKMPFIDVQADLFSVYNWVERRLRKRAHKLKLSSWVLTLYESSKKTRSDITLPHSRYSGFIQALTSNGGTFTVVFDNIFKSLVRNLRIYDGGLNLSLDSAGSELHIEMVEINAGVLRIELDGAGCKVVIDSLVVKGGTVLLNCDGAGPKIHIRSLELSGGFVLATVNGAGPEFIIELVEVNGGAICLSNGRYEDAVSVGTFQLNGRVFQSSTEFLSKTVETEHQLHKGLCFFGTNIEIKSPSGEVSLQREIDAESGTEWLILSSQASQKGPTALHAAAWAGADTIIRLLVESGANVNAEFCGIRPLDLSASEKRVDIVKYLLEKGANTEDNDAMIQLALYILSRQWNSSS